LSFLHKAQEGKPTLTFDMIEEFRQQAVDRPIIALLNKGTTLKLTKNEHGLWLDDDSRRAVAQKVVERLNTVETFRGSEMRLNDIINEQARALAKYIQNEAPSYKPYLAKW
jgi:CRISP-associated protein Cas1